MTWQAVSHQCFESIESSHFEGIDYRYNHVTQHVLHFRMILNRYKVVPSLTNATNHTTVRNYSPLLKPPLPPSSLSVLPSESETWLHH
jgi:hypothetical protein